MEELRSFHRLKLAFVLFRKSKTELSSLVFLEVVIKWLLSEQN